MLNAIRVAAKNWVGRAVLTIIMGFLILSFAIWGIGDIFKGGTSRNVATVGSAKITAEDFRTSLNNELRRIQMQVRRPVTMEEARAFGLDRELLNRKIDEAALAQKATALGLALDAPVVLSSIMDAPEFKTAGMFDRAKLADALSQAGMNEKEFVRVQEQHLMRLELYNGLLGGMNAPQTLLKAVHHYRAGQRDVEAVFLDPAKVPAPPAADEAAQKTYYETHKGEFRTVETRKATVLALSAAQVAGNVTLTEDDLRAFHAAGVLSGRFGTPERRTLERVLFDSEAEAKAAMEKLNAGGTFEALLADKKLNAADVAFGIKTKAEVSDAAQRDAVFTAGAGKVVGPFKDTFGFVLYRVGKIEAAVVAPFESVKDRIVEEARAAKLARDPAIAAKFEATTKTIEDQRIAGKSLAEAAKAAGVAVVAIPALDREGGNGAGGKVEVAGGTETVAAIFASDIGLDNEPLTLKDGSHIWYEVNAVEPARERPFEDVKAEVNRRLEAAARDKALLEQANDMIKQIEGGATLANLAQAQGLKVESFKGLKRGQRDAKLGGSGVDRAFSGPLGKPATALAADGALRAVLVPVNRTLPPFDAAEMERAGLTRQLAQGLADDMMGQYTSALRKELGVSIDQAVLSRTLGQAN
jgi:peptidyl-prolyl cis-trans isomerase D